MNKILILFLIFFIGCESIATPEITFKKNEKTLIGIYERNQFWFEYRGINWEGNLCIDLSLSDREPMKLVIKPDVKRFVTEILQKYVFTFQIINYSDEGIFVKLIRSYK